MANLTKEQEMKKDEIWYWVGLTFLTLGAIVLLILVAFLIKFFYIYRLWNSVN